MAHYVTFNDYFEVTWRKNVTSYVKSECLLQKRNSIRNILLPTRNLCYFRYKSYGPLCDFHKSGDLDLDFYPISKKKFWVVFELEYIICQKIRTIGPVVWPVHREQTDKQTDRQTRRQTDRQTDRQTNRGDQYTLQKSTILQSNERALRECILCKIGLTDWVVYLVDWQWQRSRTQSIGPNDSNERWCN